MSTAPFTFQPNGHEFVFKKKEYEGMRTVHEAPKSSQDLSLEFLSSYFHLRINDVAKKLGICATVLKKICRKNGIPRWPHRRIKSFEKRIELTQLAVSTSSGEERERLLQDLAECQRQRDLLLKNPGLISKSLSRRNTNSSSHRLNDDAFDSDDHTSDDDDNENDNDNESPTKPQTHNQTRRTLKVAKRAAPTKGTVTVASGPVIGSTSPAFGSPIISPSSSSSVSPVASLPQSSSALSLSSLGSSNSLSSANSNVSLSSTPNSATHTQRSMNAAPLRKRQLTHEFESGVISSSSSLSSSSLSVPCPCCPNNAPVYRHASFTQQPTLRPPVIFAPAPAAIPAAAPQATFDPLEAEAARTLQPLLDVINLAMFAESSLAPRV